MKQKARREEVLSLTPTLATVVGPRILDLQHVTVPQSNLEELVADPARANRLAAKYGLLEAVDAQAIVRGSLNHSYESIGLFGFSFSPERLPFAVLIVACLTMSAVAITAVRARRSASRVLAGVELEDALDIVLDSWIGRIALWLVLPPLSVFLALPAIGPGSREEAILWIGGSVLVALGLVSCSAARRL
jgi:hypothetical protein